ncbi:MAG: hypothetical protein M3Y22_10235 [Pseudomonadota bacterium]|nr:hypothetical protein [Pseudomonadota bacterium]
MAQADATYTKFDLANDNHFGVSEDDEYRIKQVAAGLAAVGDLFEALGCQDEVEIGDIGTAAIFRTFSYSLTEMVERAQFIAARRTGVSAA